MAKPFNPAPRPSISKTSISVFDECERKWALMYEKFKTPRSIRRDVILQAKLMPFNALVGQVVDDTIGYALKYYKKERAWRTDLHEGARKLLQQYFDITEEWIRFAELKIEPTEHARNHPRQPIDEIFYNGELTEAKYDALLEQVDRCIDNFMGSEVPGIITQYDPKLWVDNKGETPWFMHGDVPVYAKFDLAIPTPEAVLIFDWKTGKVSPVAEEGVRDQLHTYSAYAMSTWSATPESLKLAAVWLSTGTNCIDWVKYEPERTETLQNKWIERHTLLKERAGVYEKDWDSLFGMFDLTQDIRRCKYCQFHICEGYKRVVKNTEEY
ncbi:MAG: PD-(D/E)XK nuclease family protein [Fimbriimonadaceae bacterium]|nr:PD-(D/E)XK nuclease family protein [Fimbriimonadaceae bacterium]